MHKVKSRTRSKTLTAVGVALGLVSAALGCATSPSSSNRTADSILGMVVDEWSNPIARATVTAYGVLAETADDGSFILPRVKFPEDRATVSVQKRGFFDVTSSFMPNPDGPSNISLMLVEQVLLGTVDNAIGGTVTDANRNVAFTFPGSSFVGTDDVPVAEPVEIYGAYFDPDGPNFPLQMPGGDFRATDSSGTDGVLISYGAAAFEAKTSSGKSVKLADEVAKISASTQTGCIAIPASMRATAPDTMPVWTLSSLTNKWTSMGTATKNGSQYCFAVTSLGSINCDIFTRFSYLKGRVCKDGKAIPWATVTINQMGAQTDRDGYYRAIVTSMQQLKIATPYGSTTVGPIAPSVTACAPDIGSCSGSGCASNGSAGVSTGSGGSKSSSSTSAPTAAPTSPSPPDVKWRCSNASSVDATMGVNSRSCACGLVAPDPQAPDSACGAAADCCLAYQSQGTSMCSCYSGILSTTAGTTTTAAAFCANMISALNSQGMNASATAKCPPN